MNDQVEQTPEERWQRRLAEEGFDNYHLLKAILTSGFRLGSPHPRMGMRYSDFNRIKKDTSNDSNITSPDMQQFNNMFGRLISNGVILTDKEYKIGGGKFGACHSINPHVADISNRVLKEYVTNLLYSN